MMKGEGDVYEDVNHHGVISESDGSVPNEQTAICILSSKKITEKNKLWSSSSNIRQTKLSA